MNAGRVPICVACAVMALASGAAFAADIYWTSDQTGTVFRANADGSEPTPLYTSLAEPVGLAVDVSGGLIYWAQRGNGTIRSASLDGSGPVNTVVTLSPGHGLRGVAVDTVHGKIYWVAEFLSKIQRADLDGTHIEDVRATADGVIGVTLDPVGGKMYWGEYDAFMGGRLLRANLDGSNVQVLADEGVETPYYFTLDLAAGHIYWTDYLKGTIERSNLDGTDRLIPPLADNFAGLPIGVALNKGENKIFWTLTSGEIQRANLDGTAIETVVSDQGSTWDIAVATANGQVPATSAWGLACIVLGMLTAGSLIVRRSLLNQTPQPIFV